MNFTKTIIVVFAFIIISNSGFSQSYTDSLKNALAKNPGPADRISILDKLAVHYVYKDVKQSSVYADEIIKIAKENNLSAHRGHSAKAYVYRVGGDFHSALAEDNMALDELLLRITEKKDSIELATVLNNIGDNYYDLGEYDEAYYFFIRSFRMSNQIEFSLMKAISMHNVGRVFKSLGMYDQATEHFRLSRELSVKANDAVGDTYYYDEIGEVQYQRGQYDSALNSLKIALAFGKKFELYDVIPKSLVSIAQTYIAKGDFSKATNYLDSSDVIYNSTSDLYGLASNNLVRGYILQKQGKVKEAMGLYDRSLGIAKKLNARILVNKCYKSLSALYEQTGDYKKSLNYFKEYKSLEDSIFSKDTQDKVLSNQISLASESQLSRIEELNKEQNRTQDQLKKREFVFNIMVVVMALSVILLLTVYRSGQRRRKINLLLMQHQAEMEKRGVELERLNQVKDKFFSIISHDLRSPINALAGMLDLLDKGAILPEEFPKHIKELKNRFNHTRTLLNNLLDWTLLQMDKLNLKAAKIDLHKIVEENVQLLSAMQGKNIEIKNLTPTVSIAFADSNTVNLVIRNLITNAIKFTNDGGVVEIGATEKGFEWEIVVRDNGVGINPEVLSILFDKTAPYTTRGTANEKGTGLGLILCKEFVEKNGGKIWVESEEGKGSSFYFTLPKAN